MTNYPVKYQPQQTSLSRQATRELTRIQTDVAYIAASTRIAQEAIGAIYKKEVETVVRDLEYMNNQVRGAIEGGMPPGQVEAVYGETVRYQQYQSAVAEYSASRVAAKLQE
jgi:hypothetical protein